MSAYLRECLYKEIEIQLRKYKKLPPIFAAFLLNMDPNLKAYIYTDPSKLKTFGGILNQKILQSQKFYPFINETSLSEVGLFDTKFTFYIYRCNHIDVYIEHSYTKTKNQNLYLNSYLKYLITSLIKLQFTENKIDTIISMLYLFYNREDKLYYEEPFINYLNVTKPINCFLKYCNRRKTILIYREEKLTKVFTSYCLASLTNREYSFNNISLLQNE